MIDVQIILFGLPVLTLALSGWFAFRLGGENRIRSLVGIVCAVIALSALMWFIGMNASGWGGLLYIPLVILFGAPAALGTIIGGVAGWYRASVAEPAR